LGRGPALREWTASTCVGKTGTPGVEDSPIAAFSSQPDSVRWIIEDIGTLDGDSLFLARRVAVELPHGESQVALHVAGPTTPST
jgi:hypothetical protein